MKNTIHVERARQKITQAELAKQVGTSKQTIHKIETDQTDPSTNLSIRIARFFGLSVEDIFNTES